MEVSIQRTSDGRYWDGTDFTATSETFVAASGTTGWSYDLPATALSDGDSYTVHAISTDDVGNVSSTASSTFSYDVTAADVTVEEAAGQDDPTNAQPIRFTAQFSEPVDGFTASDVSLGGSAGHDLATITVTEGAGNSFNIEVEGIDSDGTLTAEVPADSAADAAGNGNELSTSDDNEVTYDTTDPESEASSPAFSNASATTIPVTTPHPTISGLDEGRAVGEEERRGLGAGRHRQLAGHRQRVQVHAHRATPPIASTRSRWTTPATARRERPAVGGHDNGARHGDARSVAERAAGVHE